MHGEQTPLPEAEGVQAAPQALPAGVTKARATADTSAEDAQKKAVDPARSVWLAANAGSGKTTVLTNRVVRLLLAEVDPARILCLTFTRAAAAEMQNRIFARLGGWAMATDQALADDLAKLGIALDGAKALAAARRLFARALDTPGGLKIQTIHSFCAALLRRFPLEAGLPPDFSEVEPRTLATLARLALTALAESADAALLKGLVATEIDGRLDQVLAALSELDPSDLATAGDPFTLFALPTGFDEQALLARVFTGEEERIWELMPGLRAGKDSDRKLAQALEALRNKSIASLLSLEKVLLFGPSAKAGAYATRAGTLPTKDLRQKLLNQAPEAVAALDALCHRVADARALRLRLRAAESTRALWGFARAYAQRLEDAKAARGVVTFGTLIRRAAELLENPSLAPWVLWKLDGRIEHILVDEAQDTAPEQWRVIERLVAELAAENAGRTLFVVGDRKQSIYSFQGADLKGFEAARERLAAALKQQGRTLERHALIHSFRAAQALLNFVDACFEDDPGGLGEAPTHLAFYDVPGRVDLWPLVAQPEKLEDPLWDEPLDRPAETAPAVTLARAIAQEIRTLLDAGTAIPTKNGVERLSEAHILILVRRRKGLLFDALLQACKAQGLEIAGADRLVLLDEPAVGDVLALLKALALPEDDLSLATALRSALFGWSEQDLFALAAERGGLPLVAALREQALVPGTPAAEAWAIFSDLRDVVEYLRPFELIERILTRHDGRRRLLARYGLEAEEPLDALADLALAYEGDEIPSLDGFLAWLSASGAELRRAAEVSTPKLRIMTVHGAKGLEAPLVILPDTADFSEPSAPPVVMHGKLPLPRFAKAEQPEAISALEAEAEAQRAEEYDRLLYVALTRAARWLIVAGAGEVKQPTSWYARIERGMRRLGGVPLATPVGEGLRFALGDWPQPLRAPEAQAPALPAPLLSFPRVAPIRLLSVTTLAEQMAAAKAATPPATRPDPFKQAISWDSAAYGTLVHRLLEKLPQMHPKERRKRAEALARMLDLPLPPEASRRAVAEVEAILETPALAALFGPNSLAEVPLAGPWQGSILNGIIDWLLIEPGRILAFDIKTHRNVPARAEDIPAPILVQLGAYAHLLELLHPGQQIETAILWSAVPCLMPVPADLRAQALDSAAAMRAA